MELKRPSPLTQGLPWIMLVVGVALGVLWMGVAFLTVEGSKGTAPASVHGQEERISPPAGSGSVLPRSWEGQTVPKRKPVRGHSRLA